MINLETTAVTAPPGTILLDEYAARSCPVKTQNAFNPTVAIETPADGARSSPTKGLPSYSTAAPSSRMRYSSS